MRLYGDWICKKCKRRGGMFWAAFHLHRITWRRSHPGLHRDDWQ